MFFKTNAREYSVSACFLLWLLNQERKEIMDNQFNQQSSPQQTIPQQPAPQQPAQQSVAPAQQPQYQQYAPPPRPYVDPAVAKKQKKDAFDALSDKMAAFMNTNPVFKFIGKYSDIISYIVTGVSALLTIVSMSLGRFEIIFALTAVIFGAFAVSKKTLLPLTAAMSSLSLFSLICFINRIITMAALGRFLSGGYVFSFIFSIFELGIIGYLAFVCWTYFLALLPPKTYQPAQPYYGQPVQQPTPVQQDSQSVSQKFCSACGSANAGDAAFCKICGNKF